jgi:transcriptional regulator
MREFKEKTSYHDYHMTQDQIAQYFNTSRANAGQLEKQALANFKKELEKRGLKMSDLLWR